MSPIKLVHPNPLPVAEAKRRLADEAAMWCRIYGVEQRWNGDRLELRGSLLNGHADVTDSQVDVELTLGPGAQTAKDRHDVESGVQEALTRLLRA
jgi:putative polyhydroxyalkanoate system protein